MTETDTPTREWVPLEGIELLRALLAILVDNPERHDQQAWLGNYFLTPDELGEFHDLVDIGDIRPYVTLPMPTTPESRNARFPVCGSTGCVAGWTGVLAGPPGSAIADGRIFLPDGTSQHLFHWAAPKLGLTREQAGFVFNMHRSRERLIVVLEAMIEAYPAVPENLEAL